MAPRRPQIPMDPTIIAIAPSIPTRVAISMFPAPASPVSTQNGKERATESPARAKGGGFFAALLNLFLRGRCHCRAQRSAMGISGAGTMTTINTNIGAIAAQANMAKVTDDFNAAMTRLSSGLRINAAKETRPAWPSPKR